MSISATWLWSVPPEPEAVTLFVRARGVREVFVDGADLRAVDQCASLQQAGALGAVLGGDPQWVLDRRAGVNWCRNALQRTGVDRLHLDVEPWTLPQWRTERDRLADGYARFVEAISVELPGIHVDVDMVPWLFTATRVAAQRVLVAADAVTLLAYRDRADGIRGFAAPAIVAARRLRRPYLLGVETMPVSDQVPSGTTFADDGAAVLARQLSLLDDELADDRLYRGVAVHHWATWRTLGP